MRDINAIVIHCSASRNGDAKVNASVLDSWHRDRGWKGIGYHYVVEIDGSLSVGRQESEIGAHVSGSNARSIGVCMVGTDKFTPAQWECLRYIVQDLQGKYPKATVLGHRDYSPDKDGNGFIDSWEWIKICPGFDVRGWIANGYAPAPESVL